MCAAGALVLIVSAVSGCGGGKKPTKTTIKEAIRKEAFGGASPSLKQSTVTGNKNHFVVDDEQGKRLLEADVARVEGIISSGSGMQGPVKFFNAKCKLYEKGKHSMDMEAAESTWDGEKLITSTPAHAVTADRKTIVDGRTAVWTSANGLLELTDAKMQSLKVPARGTGSGPVTGGKIDFTVEGPRARVLNRVVTLDRGGTGRNAEGQQLTGRNLRWNMDSSRLEAQGDVAVTQEGTRVTGQKLVSDTKLRRGRMTGRTRTQLTRVRPNRQSASR